MDNKKITALRDALLSLQLDELIALGMSATATQLWAIKVRCDEILSKPSYDAVPVYCGNAVKELEPYVSVSEYFTAAECDAMREGRKINAIKLVRERKYTLNATNGKDWLPLKDAKELVEEAMRRWFPLQCGNALRGY